MAERKDIRRGLQKYGRKIKLIEKELGNLRVILTASMGQFQQVDKLIIMTKEGHKSKSEEADKASEVHLKNI